MSATRSRRRLTTVAAVSATVLAAGTLLAIGQLDASGTEQVRNSAGVAAIPYAYTPEANSKVKATVMAGAGTGKL